MCGNIEQIVYFDIFDAFKKDTRCLCRWVGNEDIKINKNFMKILTLKISWYLIISDWFFGKYYRGWDLGLVVCWGSLGNKENYDR